MTRPVTLIALIALIAVGCTAAKTEPPPASEGETPAKTAAPAKPPVAKATPAAVKTPPTGKQSGHRRAKALIKWRDQLEWLSWADARAKSAAEGKSICLVVYTDWCPRCRELAPVFSDPEVGKLAEGLIMVRQDKDAKPAWLQQFSDLGSYVPRIFFFGPDGNLRRDITSPHPRYPYFYTPRGVDALKRSMRAAVGG